MTCLILGSMEAAGPKAHVFGSTTTTKTVASMLGGWRTGDVLMASVHRRSAAPAWRHCTCGPRSRGIHDYASQMWRRGEKQGTDFTTTERQSPDA
jgi:hypothetical protein